MSRKPKTPAAPKRALMSPVDFDKSLAALIEEASENFARRAPVYDDTWVDIAIRLERTRTLVREMMTPEERGLKA
jgi:hypothetical protein